VEQHEIREGECVSAHLIKIFEDRKVQEFTYKSGESVVEIPVATREMQYLYKEGDRYLFMDNKSYEQFAIRSDAGRYVNYLKPNDVYQVLVNGDRAVGLQFPRRYASNHGGDKLRGNTVSRNQTVVVKPVRSLLCHCL
jgi:elongation factor P